MAAGDNQVTFSCTVAAVPSCAACVSDINNYDSTQPRLKSCGWALLSNIGRWTSVTFRFWRRWKSSSPLATSESPSTASCHYICTRSADLDISNFDTLRPAVCSLTTEAAKTLIQAFVCCRLDRLLQLTSVWRVWRPHSEASVGAERRRTANHRLVPDNVIKSRTCCVGCTGDESESTCLLHQSLAVWSSTADDSNLVADSSRQLLQSAAGRTCVVPGTHNTFGSLLPVTPQVWNNLSSQLR